ncbi:MAG TPA: Rpn family recombination-promoting nuclease/putative transposase, partial [Polyangiaceae bacterium]|nr:Rpn family recombination-promoting nuclease/putative transposase [Polyangiaceae bacterium]
RWTLDPRIDLVFSLLFGAEQNRRLLISFLNDVLQPETLIASVEVLPSRPEMTDVEGKLVFLDLRVRLANGEDIDVEMQTRRHAALRARVLLYWGRMYTGQLQRGDSYSGLQRCVVVLITDFRELLGHEFHSVFQVRERSRGDLLSDHLEVHVLELPKLPDVVGVSELALARWCRFLAAETDEQIEALAMEHPVLKEAKDALDRLSADPEARERAERRAVELRLHEYGAHLLREQGREEGREQGREEGRERGREEGREQQKLATLRRQLFVKFGTLPAEVEARIQSATDCDVERWLERVVVGGSVEDVFG